jgi:hypothetical protein
MSPGEVKELDEVKSKVMTPSQTDMVSLFHIKQSAMLQTNQTYWHLIATTSVCAFVILGILYLSLRTYLCNLATRCFPQVLFPNPVPLSKIPLLYHPSRDEENTLLTTMIVRQTSPSYPTRYSPQTDNARLTSHSFIIFNTHRASNLASKSSVPCPTALRRLRCQHRVQLPSEGCGVSSPPATQRLMPYYTVFRR